MKTPATPREQIGPYRIVERVGAGGMGEVFKAWDPRLEREVAIKLLHPETAADPDRQKRLVAEGRAASALNHPNIVRVYDADIDGDSYYLVSEWLEGKSLRDELSRGALPVKRLLDLAVQIADGLAAAHAAGIVHRDIKPENVMLARDGTARIVDFGLARSDPHAPSRAAEVAQASTVTLEGGLSGTPAYMSPEQARGTLGDFRTDQFSFGVLMYEMATGTCAFRRDTMADTLAAVLNDEAKAIVDINPRVPAAVTWIIEQCLAKDAGDRYTATEDLAKELRRVRERLREAYGKLEPAQTVTSRRWAIPAAIVMTAGITAAAVLAIRPNAPDLRFTPIASAAAYEGGPVWSPDGQSLAWVADVDGVLQVFTRRLADSVATQVTRGRFDAEEPFWSPDGSTVYFISAAGDGLALWTVGVAGGRPELLIENVNHAAIDRTGQRLLLLRTKSALDQQLWWAARDGSGLSQETRPPFGSALYGVGGQLQFRPDGEAALVWVYTAAVAERGNYYMVPVRADLPIVEVLAHVGRSASLPPFSWLPDNRHLVIGISDGDTGRRHLWVADTQSTALRRLTSTHTTETWPAASPDGARIAYASEEVDFDLVAISDTGELLPKPLATARNEMDPAWAPNGEQYAFVTDRSGTMEIWLRSRDGQWERPIVTGHNFGEALTDTLGSLAFSPEGRMLAYHRRGSDDAAIWLSPVTGGTPVRLLTERTRFNFQDAPSWSADGEWVAFLAARGTDFSLAKARPGTSEVVVLLDRVMPFTRASWSPDGRWILCETTDGLVRVTPEGATQDLLLAEPMLAYGWAADSRHVFALVNSETTGHIAVLEIDTATHRLRTLNGDLTTIPIANQPIRGFSYVRGRGFLTSLASARSDLWLLEGFKPPARWPFSWLRR